MDIRSACVVGAGRVGTAVAARLGESIPTRVVGRDLDRSDEAELVLLCVPDRAIAEVAAALPPVPWVAHTSGACTLDALDPHRRRFSLHPLQTFTLDRGPEQLDGAWAAVTGETVEAREAGFALAACSGSSPSRSRTPPVPSTTPARPSQRVSSQRSTRSRPSCS